MNEALGSEDRNIGFPRESFREIITKAVCGTGRKSIRYTNQFNPPGEIVPSQILGCSVTELKLYEPEVKDNSTQQIILGVGGVFEVHVWYAFNNGKETDVLRCPIDFEESIPLEDYDCQNANFVDARVKVDKNPVVVESLINGDDQIQLATELDISVEVSGETKLLVQVHISESD